MTRPCEIDDVLIRACDIHRDERGSFQELGRNWKQTNLSISHAGVIRGMHIQTHKPQAKLIRVLRGAVWDCWVDLREKSKTFGKWGYHILNEQTPESIYLPPGFAHGFYSLAPGTMLHYQCSEIYNAKYDSGVLWNDPEVGIEWPFMKDMKTIISEKDIGLPTLRDYLRLIH